LYSSLLAAVHRLLNVGDAFLDLADVTKLSAIWPRLGKQTRRGHLGRACEQQND